MKVELEIDKLSELLTTAAQNGANRALEQVGAIASTITLAEFKKKHGKALGLAARKSTAIKWMPLGSGGRTSGVYCKRSEIDKFLFERKFEFNSK